MNTPSSNDFRTTKAVLLGRLRSHDVDFTVRFRTLTKLLYDVIVYGVRPPAGPGHYSLVNIVPLGHGRLQC